MNIPSLKTVSSQFASRNVNNASQSQVMKALQNQSTGVRINSTVDEAAAADMSAAFKSNLMRLSKAARNVRDAQQIVTAAGGGLEEVSGILARLRELAVQGSSASLAAKDRTSNQEEAGRLQDEMTRIANVVTVKDRKLLDGSFQNVRFEVGINPGDDLELSIRGVSAPNIDLTSVEGAAKAVTTIDASLESITRQRNDLGLTGNRLDGIASGLQGVVESIGNRDGSNTRITDVDVATASASLTRNQILAQAGTAMLAQANSLPQVAMSLLG